MEIDQEKRLIEALRFYRNMGFFKSDSNLNEQQLIEKIGNKTNISSLYTDTSTHEYGLPSYFDDIILLSYDEGRIWFKDVESDVCEGNNIYVRTLNEWSLISMNKFNPIDIVEKWTGNKINIEFTLLGEKKTICPSFLNDFIDISILDNINSFIKSSGYQFEISVLDQLVFVCLLSKDEKEMLQFHRKIEFYKI